MQAETHGKADYSEAGLASAIESGSQVQDLHASRWNPTESRRERMMRWIIEHPEFDHPNTKGVIRFDLGRRPSGALAVSAVFHATAEEL